MLSFKILSTILIILGIFFLSWKPSKPEEELSEAEKNYLKVRQPLGIVFLVLGVIMLLWCVYKSYMTNQTESEYKLLDDLDLWDEDAIDQLEEMKYGYDHDIQEEFGFKFY